MQRRKHHKSRKGCLPCKARRIKCDEQGPPCFNCVTRQSECSYASDRVAPQPTSNTRSPNSGPENEDEQSIDSSRPRNKFELQLMLQWTTITYKTMSLPKDYEKWQYQVPSDGLQHDFLLDGLFAIAAMHVADTGECASQDRKVYIDAAFVYFSQFCKSFQQELVHCTPTNQHVFHNASIMMIVLGLHPPAWTCEQESYLDRIITVYGLIQGAFMVSFAARSKPAGLNGGLETLLQLFASSEPSEDTSVALQRVKRIAEDSVASSAAIMETNTFLYRQVLYLLGAWWEKAHHKDLSTASLCLLTWPEPFLELLKQNDRIALLIMLHWAVMLDELCEDRVWWAVGFGPNLVHELCDTLDVHAANDSIWFAALSWCRERVTRLEGQQFFVNGDV